MNDQPRPSGAEDVTLSVIDDLDALRELAPAWRALLMATPGSCAYQAPEWVITWFEHAANGDRPHVVSMHRGDQLVGVAPFVVTRVLKLPFEVVITAATEPGDYGDPLLATERRAELARLLADHLSELARDLGQAVAVRRVDTAGAFHAAVSERDDVTVAETSMATSPITRFADWDDPEDEIERLAAALKLPKQRRRIERDHGPLEVRTRAPVTPCLEAMAALHRQRFGVDDAPRLLARPRSMALVCAASEALDQVGIARMCRLSAGGSTAALELGHDVRTRWVGQAAGFDPEMGKYRPGYLLVHEILRRALADGAAEYDHGQGVQDYKTHWSTEERHHRSFVLSNRGLLGYPERFLQRWVASIRARSLLAGSSPPAKAG